MKEQRAGFTLIEIIVAIAVMSIFATVTVTSMGVVLDDARFNQTQRELEQIRASLVGETQRLETGLRRKYGMLGDIGRLPSAVEGLAALSSMPVGISSWTFNSSLGIGAGWRGPYLENTSDQNFFKDGWGNDYIYTYAGPGNTATIKSYGSDGVDGGTGYAADMIVSIPNDVITGRLLGYVVTAQGDITGADQVPFSNSAQVVIYSPNASAGFTSQTFNLAAASSGKYAFSSLPLGFSAIRVFIPNIGSPSQTLGPSIVEINKAATAALPAAQDSTSVYGTSSACTTAQNFTVLSGTYSKDNVARTVEFQIRYPQDFSWSGTFYAEQEGAVPIVNMEVTNMATVSAVNYRSSSGLIRPYTAGGFNNIATNTNATLSAIALSSNTDYKLKFSYSATGWNNDHSVYIYQIGCKFVRAHPGL